MTHAAVDCGAVIRELWDWLDGELSPERLDAIRRHLAACHGCERHVAFARAFLDRVQAAPPTDAGVDALRARIRDALANDPG